MVLGMLLVLVPTIIGIIWWFKQKPEYAIMFATAGGETKAYASKDKQHVSDIIVAVNDAIVHQS